MLGGAGRTEEAVSAFRDAVRVHPEWPEFLRRCVAAGLVPPEAGAMADALATHTT